MLLRIFFLSAVAGSTALAQNSDLGLMIGVAHVVDGFTSTTATSGTVSVGGQINFATQIRDLGAGRLYFELPLHVTEISSGTVANGVSAGTTTAILYLTPGVRWNFRPAARVWIYAVGGGGAAIVAYNAGVAGPGFTSGVSGVHATGAFDYGVGLDVRITRLVSFRTEARQVLSIGPILGRHHNEFFTMGVGLHF
jgi:hypothetical protein